MYRLVRLSVSILYCRRNVLDLILNDHKALKNGKHNFYYCFRVFHED